MDIPKIRYIDLPAGRMAYRKGGEGAPLLLLHGWGGSSRHWLGAFATLTEHYTVYALDLPGFGESAPGMGGRLRALSEATLAVIDILGLTRLGLVGHSLGGAVALLVAAARPQAVERLALVSFGLARSSEEEAKIAAIGAQISLTTALWAPWLTMLRPWLALSRPWRQIFWTMPPLPAFLAAPMLHRLPDPAALTMGIVDLAAMDALAALEGASAQGDPLVARAAAQATMPTLVLNGRQDPIFPSESAATLAAALPDASLSIIDACGHVPMAEQPAACYGALAGFFALA